MPPKRNRDGYATFWRLRACPERSRMGQSPLLMIIETQRLILRPFREEDLDLLAELMANPDFMRFRSALFHASKRLRFWKKS
jgi:RimJ/RimL family protein N-acetyltransferase